jgi:hypothetical protein
VAVIAVSQGDKILAALDLRGLLRGSGGYARENYRKTEKQSALQ